MKNKLLLFLITSLFGYQFTKGYTWTVYNATGINNIEVTVKVDAPAHKKQNSITKKIPVNQSEEFEFKGVMAGMCLKDVFVNGIPLKKMGITKGQLGAITIVGSAASYCKSRDIVIGMTWGFVNKKDLKKLKYEKAKDILKPIDFSEIVEKD